MIYIYKKNSKVVSFSVGKLDKSFRGYDIEEILEDDNYVLAIQDVTYSSQNFKGFVALPRKLYEYIIEYLSNNQNDISYFYNPSKYLYVEISTYLQATENLKVVDIEKDFYETLKSFALDYSGQVVFYDTFTGMLDDNK